MNSVMGTGDILEFMRSIATIVVLGSFLNYCNSAEPQLDLNMRWLIIQASSNLRQ